jgi:hypothetical protein
LILGSLLGGEEMNQVISHRTVNYMPDPPDNQPMKFAQEDDHAFPGFRKYAKKDIYGNVIEIDLPNDAIVGPSASQTKFASILLKEKYPNWKTDLGLTEEQINALEKNRGSIGPKGWSMEARKEKLTWHHDKESGKMVLVPFDLNNKYPHTGGHEYWGSQPTD